ncbi:glycosyl hydrolase family 35 [Oesophagostomum dentatum]|uniref:Glycosyl hydrolase family 35 n=1 Tax=Oesophagostomum dentatum TaxID=61180 RepID=A0A0B1SPW9_OESDE|nr:glycosyl hydrolase family 35 [Oesophagostomum dentatum]
MLLLLTLVGSALAQRSFSIDYENNQFLRDGKPFRYISGSVHYFRTHPDQWETRIQSIRAAGLNAIETYIPWNFHETYQGKYDFTGIRNFTRFFDLAAKYDLAVIVRPGPYICAEWENGGLPYWLLNYPGVKLRSSESK